MNTLEKLNAITRTLPALDSPVMKMIRQQQKIQEGFQRLSGNQMSVLKQATAIAKYSPVAGLSALTDLRAAAISLPKQADWMINAKAPATISIPLIHPAIAALDGLRETALSFPKQTDWLDSTKSLALSHKTQAAMLAKSLTGLGSALAIGIDDRLLYPSKHLKSLANAGVLSSIAAIPTDTLASIRNIVGHQAKFNALAAGFSEYGKPLAIPRTIYPDSFQSTLKALSRTLDKKAFEFTTVSVIDRRWDAIENFDILFNEAIELTETIANEESDVEALNRRVLKFIDAVRYFLGHHLTSPLSWAFILSSLVNIFMATHQYIDFLKPKPESVTKQDLLDTQKEINRLRLDLHERIEHSVANYKCAVYLKPNTKSLKVGKLLPGIKVELLDTNRRWVHISFNDEKDNYTITGWVLKKYLGGMQKDCKLEHTQRN